MKFEDVLNEPRLPLDEEVVVPELEKVIDNPSALPTPELVVGIESARDQEIVLQKEKETLDAKACNLGRSYGRAKERLDTFKKAKGDIKKSLETHAHALSEIEVATVSDALHSPRLRGTNEVREYSKSRQALRDTVADFMAMKKGIKRERFKKVKDLSFQAEERDASIRVMYDTVSEIRGSEKALARDKEGVLNELVERAENDLKTKVAKISNEYVRVHNEGTPEERRFLTEDRVIDLYYDALVKNGVEFGVEASNTARESIGFLTEEQEAQARLRINTRDNGDFKKLEEGEKKSEVLLEALNKRKEEVEKEFKEKYDLDLDTLPINIQVVTPDGHQGLHSDEGETVAYAFIYKGKDEYNDAQQTLETKKAEFLTLNKDVREQEESLRDEMAESPASFFDFSLKKKYKKQQDEIDVLKKQLDALAEEVNALEKQGEVLQSQITRERVPLNILDLVDTVELVNYYYVHDNFGRGHEGARQKSPMQTVGDFFRIFKEKREGEIVESREKQRKYAEDNQFALHEAFEEKKKKLSKKR